MNELRASDKANPGFLIRRLQQITVSLFMNELKSVGITPVQYTILRVISENPGSEQVGIARLAALDTSTTTDVLGRLQDKGLIVRRSGVRDRRTRTVDLTEAGRLLLDEARPLVRGAQARLLAPLSAMHRAEFLDILQALIEGHEEDTFDRHGTSPWRRLR